MTNPTPPGPPPGSPHEILKKLTRKLVLRAAVVALAVALVWWLYPAAPPPRPPEAPPAEPAPPAPGSSPAAPTNPTPDRLERAQARAEVMTAASASAGTRSAAKARQEQFLALADESKRAADAALAAEGEFSRTLEALLGDDRGKALAASDDLIGQFRTVAEAPRTSGARLKALGEQVERLAAPVRRAAADPDDLAKPADDAARLLRGFAAEAEAARADYRRATTELEALARAAPGPPGPVPLQDAVARHREREALATATLVADARARARKKADEKRAAAEAEAVRLAGDADARGIIEDARRKKAAADAAEAGKAASAEKERLRRKVKDPEVERYLGAFFAKGYKQPKEVQGTFLAFERTATAQPISFSRLQTLGALADDATGLVMLNWVADGEAQNDRPRWRFGHQNSWTADGQKFIKRAQELLVELGPTLVEEGLLAK